MDTQTAYQQPSRVELSRPTCPCCGSRLLMAEQSVFNLHGRIRNSWCCDDCGNEFTTSIPALPWQA